MAKVKRHKPRNHNHVATAAILRKGGVHEQSGSSKRQKGKKQLRKLLDNVKAGSSGLDFAWSLAKRLIIAH